MTNLIFTQRNKKTLIITLYVLLHDADVGKDERETETPEQQQSVKSLKIICFSFRSLFLLFTLPSHHCPLSIILLFAF